MPQFLLFSGPNLNVARYGHSCDILSFQNPETEVGGNVVVVAGGYNGKVLSSVELLFVDDVEAGKKYY